MNPHAIFQKLLMLWFVNYILWSSRKRFCVCIACNAIIIMVCGVFESFRPTWDKIECLHNLWEFSQPLDCLYKAMQKQQMVFYSSYKISFLKKNKKILCYRHWWKDKFLGPKMWQSKLCTLISFGFAKKIALKYWFFLLKMSA